MKKTIFSIIALVLVSVSSFAQEPLLKKGRNTIDAGIGFSSGLSDIVLPPLTVSYEHVFTTFGNNDCMGVGAGVFGGLMAQKFYDETFAGGVLCLQGNFHYSPIAKLDLYTGLHVGYTRVATSGASAGESTVGYQLGARYFFADSIGGFLQFGGFGTINLGVSFKF